jgi:DNA helicase HerA-like ATPase
MTFKENYIMTIYGKKGSGKSYLAENFTEKLNRLIVWDTMRIFDVSFIPVYSFKSFLKYVNKIRNNEIVKFRLSLRLNKAYFDDVCKILTTLDKLTFIVDELQVYVSALKIPDGLNELITESRHFEINLIFITQRPVFIPRIILANADYIACFEMQLKSDLDIISTYKYSNPEAIKTLGDYQFYFIDLKRKKGYVCKV